MNPRTAAVAVLLSGSLLVGCGTDNPTVGVGGTATPTTDPTSAAPSTAPTLAPPTATNPPAPPFPANTLVDTSEPSGGQLAMDGATAGLQTGYDRVVFTLAGGPGIAGWRVEYVAAPTSDGSGDPVAVAGSAYLQVLVRNLGIPPDTGVPEPTNKRFSPPGLKVVKEVVLDSAFEGQYTAFIGLSATRPFRVFRLGSPERVVVDVRHS